MAWTDEDVLARAHYYLIQAEKAWTEPLSLWNFKVFYAAVLDCIQFHMSAAQRCKVDMAWANRFAALYNDLDKRVKADPILLYRPRTSKHARFHSSLAFIRYLLAANGVGKTHLAAVENVLCATGQGHYRGNAGDVVVVSTGHTVYSEQVFIKKFVIGEAGDPLTPFVPEGGKWFHSFDQRKYLLRVACERCAEAGHPTKCTHLRQIQCLSADSGRDRLMGFKASLVHIDELVDEDIYNEMRQRLRRGGAKGRMVVTSTPLAGPDHWTVRKLYELFTKRPAENWIDPSNHAEGAFVDVFEISKYDCIGSPGGPTLGEIEGERATMSPSEFEVRVKGRPIPLGNSLFNLHVLDAIETDECRPAEYGGLWITGDGINEDTLEWGEDIEFQAEQHNLDSTYQGLHVWEHPIEGAQYAIGADSASGVSDADTKDASVAYVFKLIPQMDGRLTLEMVALHYSFLDIYSYAVQCKILATYYNQAVVVPEITGIGAGLISVLSRQLGYPAVFAGENHPELIEGRSDSKFGVNTNAQTKPTMIAALKHMIQGRELVIRDKEAISECRTFQQTPSESGLSYRYRAASGAHDDRVMAMALVAYAIRQFPDLMAAYSLSPTKRPAGPAGNYFDNQSKHRRKDRPKPWIA